MTARDETALCAGQILGLLSRLNEDAAREIMAQSDSLWSRALAATMRLKAEIFTPEAVPLPQSVAALFAELDAALEPHIAKNVLPKGAVIAVLATLRDVVRSHDPQLAERLIPVRCEAAMQSAVTPL